MSHDREVIKTPRTPGIKIDPSWAPELEKMESIQNQIRAFAVEPMRKQGWDFWSWSEKYKCLIPVQFNQMTDSLTAA